MEIKFIPREEIDRLKWDSCVHYANAGNIFGYTWYLDNVVRDWDGLIEGDYESVFPLIKKERFLGVRELYSHELLPQSGLYSVNVLSQKRVATFLGNIPKEYLIADIPFSTFLSFEVEGYERNESENYSLLLNQTYEAITENYSDTLKLILGEENNNLQANDLKPEELADNYIQYAPNAKEENRHTYLRIMYNLMHRGTGFMIGVRDENRNFLAGDFFARGHGKITSLLPVYNGIKGKEAYLRMLDMFIRSQADNTLKIDFNISMGMDMFAPDFGAKRTPFVSFAYNLIPSWKKWIYK